MTKYVAFLRGINVGGRLIKMADLKQCLENVGLADIRTILQSGNVVFESERTVPELKKLIEETLAETFGFPVKAQVVTVSKLAEIVDQYPFGVADDDQHDYVIFMENGLEGH